MEKSTHKVEIVPVRLEKHPSADNLSIVQVYGYTCCIATRQWQEEGHPLLDKSGYLGAWIPPDSLVNTTRPEFAFLAGEAKYFSDSFRGGPYARIRAKKLRGVVSYGFLVPYITCDPNTDGLFGANVADELDVHHYNPPLRTQTHGGGLYMGGEVAPAPKITSVKYDVDSFQRYAKTVFVEGEPCIISEKLHGASSRYVYHNGEFYCGSRTDWKREYPCYAHVTVESLLPRLTELVEKAPDDKKYDPLTRAKEIVDKLQSKPKTQNMWWTALEKYPQLKEFLKLNSGLIVHGEVYGAVQDMKYGHGPGEVSIAIFDMMRDGKWLEPDVLWRNIGYHNLPAVPLLAGPRSLASLLNPIPYNFDEIVSLADGPSFIPGANHPREGIVVSPVTERYHEHVGRVKLKVVSQWYLTRKETDVVPEGGEES